MTKVSVRLGDLIEAVDREAALARRSRSEMVRFLIEDALRMRHEGVVRHAAPWSVDVDGKPIASGPASGYIERFEGCATPDRGTTYRVLRDAWTIPGGRELPLRVVYEYEVVN